MANEQICVVQIVNGEPYVTIVKNRKAARNLAADIVGEDQEETPRKEVMEGLRENNSFEYQNGECSVTIVVATTEPPPEPDEKPAARYADIRKHAGNKYLRRIYSAVDGEESVEVDVYAVLEAFIITCPARQHALKKLLCAGVRGKGSQMQDLEEAINSCGPRILQLQRTRENQSSA